MLLENSQTIDIPTLRIIAYPITSDMRSTIDNPRNKENQFILLTKPNKILVTPMVQRPERLTLTAPNLPININATGLIANKLVLNTPKTESFCVGVKPFKSAIEG